MRARAPRGSRRSGRPTRTPWSAWGSTLARGPSGWTTSPSCACPSLARRPSAPCLAAPGLRQPRRAATAPQSSGLPHLGRAWPAHTPARCQRLYLLGETLATSSVPSLHLRLGLAPSSRHLKCPATLSRTAHRASLRLVPGTQQGVLHPHARPIPVAALHLASSRPAGCCKPSAWQHQCMASVQPQGSAARAGGVPTSQSCVAGGRAALSRQGLQLRSASGQASWSHTCMQCWPEVPACWCCRLHAHRRAWQPLASLRLQRAPRLHAPVNSLAAT